MNTIVSLQLFLTFLLLTNVANGGLLLDAVKQRFGGGAGLGAGGGGDLLSRLMQGGGTAGGLGSGVLGGELLNRFLGAKT
uniref:Glycine rich superfamily member n=1 Tax=Rhipicephalus appendiculatus TaxID=34631 RepID=A0A131YBA9_RHIAP